MDYPRLRVVEDDPWNIRRLAIEITRTPTDVSIEELIEKVRVMSVEKNRKFVLNIVKKYGHYVVLEFGKRALLFDKVSRFTALYIWRMINTHNQVYLSGLETSFRLITPPFKCIDKYSERVYKKAKYVYDAALDQGIPPQDARYVLPEGVLTRIIFNFDPCTERYWGKIKNGLIGDLPEHKRIIEFLDRELCNVPYENTTTRWHLMKKETSRKRRTNSAWIYGHYYYFIRKDATIAIMRLCGSLSMYAQLVRERLASVELEPIYSIKFRSSFVVPPSFTKDIMESYMDVIDKALHEQHKASFPAYAFLLGQAAEAIFRVYGLDAIKKIIYARCCGSAQWEIRNVVGIPLAEAYGVPIKCSLLGYCPEPKTFACPIRMRFKNMSDFEKLQALRTKYEILQVSTIS